MNTKNEIDIFIIDDNKIFSMALMASIQNAFKNRSIKISVFETGEKCMETFVNTKPELVVLDYHLNSRSPNAADGIAILNKIKEQNFNTSVIMLTSDDHIDIALKSFHLGASDYVIKAENQFEKINESITKIFNAKEKHLQKEERNKKDLEELILSKELRFKRALVFQANEKEKKDRELFLANEQKVEIEKHKLALEEKNKDITDSIHYAKRIQQAKLPKESEIYSALSDSFVLFKPKDIVSGDFYFFYKKGDSIFIAAADCTGHGVPGAFMSIIGTAKLEEAVTLSSDTSEILNHLNKGMKNSLHQSDSNDSTRDGMDIAICCINTKSRVVKYAGANRPFWLIRENGTILEEIKATKKAIGGYTEDNQFFDSHELKLNKGDTFYIATDGYADQFGGEYGKKLMTKKFKEILVGIQEQSMDKQKKHLDQFVEKWKENIEQVDDILVIGVRL